MWIRRHLLVLLCLTFFGCYGFFGKRLLASSDGTIGTSIISSSWTKLPDMPCDREQHGFEACNGVLYVVGGHDINGNYPDFLSFDGRWNELGKPPIVVQSPVLKAVGNKLYLIGGYMPPKKYANVFVYDTALRQWTEKTPMLTAREDMGAAVIGNKIYVFGGVVQGHVLTNNLEVYNTVTDTWRNISNSQRPRALGDFACGWDGRMYFVSGTNTMNGYPYVLKPTQSLLSYDPLIDVWLELPEIPIGRCYGEVVAYDSKLYIVSGATSSIYNSIPNVQIYDIAENQWCKTEPLPYSARGISLAIMGSSIYASGGTGHADFYRYEVTK